MKKKPFDTKSIPNKVTMAAIKEAEEMMEHPEDNKSYNSVGELMDDLEK